jgi:hypothetical protein
MTPTPPHPHPGPAGWGCPYTWAAMTFEPPVPLSCIDAVYVYPR